MTTIYTNNKRIESERKRIAYKVHFLLINIISLVLRNPIYYRSIFIALVYVHHTSLFFYSIDLSKSFICYKNMFLHVLHVRSYALVVLLANYYEDTLY